MLSHCYFTYCSTSIAWKYKSANTMGREVIYSYNWYILQLRCKIRSLELDQLICSLYKKNGLVLCVDFFVG